MVGVGITPPKVLGTPKPASSVTPCVRIDVASSLRSCVP